MPQTLVRVRIDGVETNVSAAFAETKGLEVIEESIRNPDGSLRGPSRANGRKAKPRTSPAKKAAAKKAAVIEPAPTKKEQDR